ncbi:SAC3 family protein C isoform X2 [Rhodamnia argentea]|uniref:SAC3 family protein C isoform X2 n=1 Tax=Rhodamnia argentea TaxID=178133 RepID=A0ABM3HD90_9MYRT|nr:SAC3 family protein C isoform X2 [Rhodamnia argentea]
MERRQKNQQQQNPRRNPLSSSSSSSSSHSSNRKSRYRPPNRASGDARARHREDSGLDSGDATTWDEPRSLARSIDERASAAGTRSSMGIREQQEQHQHHQDGENARDSREFASAVGTCPYMCPVGEMAQRERLRDLAVFERLHGNPAKTSPELAVKKFCRTISTRHVQLSDIRPLSVLGSTLDYLMNLMNSTPEPFETVHDFIFDRTRSIRQDLSMQDILDKRAIHMYEKMVNFHVISHHKLRLSSSGPNSFNISSLHHLNMEQLAKVLTSLYNLYDLNRDHNSMHKNEPEYRSLYVLLCLNSESLPEGERLSLWFRRVPTPVIKSKEMTFARRILRYFRTDNYKCFFSTIAAEASYLQYCALEPYIDKVRALAVLLINNGGYKLHPYPIAHLSNLLMMERWSHSASHVALRPPWTSREIRFYPPNSRPSIIQRQDMGSMAFQVSKIFAGLSKLLARQIQKRGIFYDHLISSAFR